MKGRLRGQAELRDSNSNCSSADYYCGTLTWIAVGLFVRHQYPRDVARRLSHIAVLGKPVVHLLCTTGKRGNYYQQIMLMRKVNPD
jgi:hypothetical protein